MEDSIGVVGSNPTGQIAILKQLPCGVKPAFPCGEDESATIAVCDNYLPSLPSLLSYVTLKGSGGGVTTNNEARMLSGQFLMSATVGREANPANLIWGYHTVDIKNEALNIQSSIATCPVRCPKQCSTY